MHGGAGSDYIDSIEISGDDIETKKIKASEISFPYTIPALKKKEDTPLINDILIEIKFKVFVSFGINRPLLFAFKGLNSKSVLKSTIP